MKKYIAILNQNSGCDYTIGCGVNRITFEAENGIDAALKLKEIIKNKFNSNEHKLVALNYYEISASYSVDIFHWYNEFANEEKEHELDLFERQEYERLKLKFEKK